MFKNELLKFILNGLFATLVHYTTLNINISFFKIESAGYANFLASIVGIITSFLGNKFYVFKDNKNNKFCIAQLVKFIMIYGFLAILHGLFLYIWSDVYKYSYHIGFLIAVCLQFVLSFTMNKVYVFKNKECE